MDNTHKKAIIDALRAQLGEALLLFVGNRVSRGIMSFYIHDEKRECDFNMPLPEFVAALERFADPRTAIDWIQERMDECEARGMPESGETIGKAGARCHQQVKAYLPALKAMIEPKKKKAA